MRENLIKYGEVSGELCANCHNCSDYEMSLHYNYTKFLFISFPERNQKYFLRCKNCRVYSEISRPKAQYMIDARFGEFERKRKLKMRIKNAFSVLLIGAAIFGIISVLPSDPDMVYKNLIADKPDGYYEIYDKEGNLWAEITKEGSMRYDLLVKREAEKADEYAGIEEDRHYEYYYSDRDGTLKYVEDNAGALLDKNGICIQYYFYDSEEKDLFYDFGVDRPERIAYSDNRALYPMTYYSEENEYYWKVFERGGSCEMILLFRDTKKTAGSGGFVNALKPAGSSDYSGDRLQTAEVCTLDNGRAVKYEYYDFSGAEELSPALLNLNRQSGLDEAVETLKKSAVGSAYVTEFTYYKDTKVVESASTVYRDASGMQMTDYTYYNIEEKGGYYIVSEKKNKLDEGQRA